MVDRGGLPAYLVDHFGDVSNWQNSMGSISGARALLRCEATLPAQSLSSTTREWTRSGATSKAERGSTRMMRSRRDSHRARYRQSSLDAHPASAFRPPSGGWSTQMGRFGACSRGRGLTESIETCHALPVKFRSLLPVPNWGLPMN